MQLIGDVRIAADASIWFNTVVRADINTISIGERTNIQDGSVLHVTEELPVAIGTDVTVGHRAVIHACTVGDCCLIGMGAVLLDAAVIGRSSLVAAGSVVLPKSRVPDGSLVAGVPARVVRRLSDEEIRQIKDSALHYISYARQYRT